MELTESTAGGIAGAGLAGLIAAHAFPRMPIFEAADGPADNHKALLRFRSSVVGDLVGIEFRPVEVRKGIWMNGGFVAPTIQTANLYSRKVLGGKMLPRSIWNLDPVTRYIAPETFYEELIENVGSRIEWGTQVKFVPHHGAPLISTAPLPVMAEYLDDFHATEVTFEREPITVQRFRVPGADVYQTVYFPGHDTDLYRASITGDLLICEFAGDGILRHGWANMVRDAFGICPSTLYPDNKLERVAQKYGKIAPIDEAKRKALIGRLTTENNIYALGRFATWRNLLLDDVVKDIAVIKRLMKGDAYGRRIANT